MDTISYFNSHLDKRFIDVLDVAIVASDDRHDDALLTFKMQIGQLLADFCVEDFLGYFHKNEALFYCIDNENTDAEMLEIKTLYLTSLRRAKLSEQFVCELFVKQMTNEIGADQIHAFITIYPVKHSIPFTIASCLSYIASMYANMDLSLSVPLRQKRFKNYVSTFKHMNKNQYKQVFDLLEFDTNLVAEV